MKSNRLVQALIGASMVATSAVAHPPTLHKAQKAQQLALAREDTQSEAVAADASCQLTIQLRGAETQKLLPGLIRVTNLKSGKTVALKNLVRREQNWYAILPSEKVGVPRAKLKLQAFHGLTTKMAEQVVDLSGKSKATVELSIHRFYDTAKRNLHGGNTHLHLMNLTHAEAIRYLKTAPQADDLDLVFLSHLRRLPDERNYISNEIVENSFAGGSLKRLSQGRVLFANGEEHRHNFGRGGEGYGHVMLLDLIKLIRPVSIGPGIMRAGTDGRPLQTGIREARRDGATVIWCHNTFGFEDLPNWAAGVLDAQNIHDGGSHGSYKDTFYRYLNIGMKVPFSTGTDWFIYDFSRVYTPVAGKLTTKGWLRSLKQGRSYITNGPFLEFQVEGRGIGETIALQQAATLTIQDRALGRNDFRGLELIHNGKVVHSVTTKQQAGHFSAEMPWKIKIDQPGWLALRIPLKNSKNEFGKTLFAHTSPIYITMNGRSIFQPEIIKQMVDEIQSGVETIQAQGKFADDTEREAVLKVYRQGIQRLKDRVGR